MDCKLCSAKYISCDVVKKSSKKPFSSRKGTRGRIHMRDAVRYILLGKGRAGVVYLHPFHCQRPSLGYCIGRPVRCFMNRFGNAALIPGRVDFSNQLVNVDLLSFELGCTLGGS